MKFEHFSSHKKILERKRHPKSPNSMLFLSIQIFPSQWRTSSPQVWHCWNHDLERFQTSLLMSTSKNPPRQIFEENCFNETTWIKNSTKELIWIYRLISLKTFLYHRTFWRSFVRPTIIWFLQICPILPEKTCLNSQIVWFLSPKSKKYMGSTALFSWGQKNLRYFVNTFRNFRKKILGRDETGRQVTKKLLLLHTMNP